MLVLPGSSYFCPGAWHLTQITVFGHNSCIYVNELIIIKFKVQLDNNIAAWNLSITIPHYSEAHWGGLPSPHSHSGYRQTTVQACRVL